MRLVAEIVRDVVADVRATLPSSEDEAGPFLAGMCWMFVTHWVLVILVTWLYLRAQGAH
jgi:hypothetical protein